MSHKKAKRQRQEIRRTSEEMRTALAEQLRLLAKRCRDFDNGDWGEAADMATRMRVILNPGGKSSPSILQSQGAEKVPLLTTCRPIPETALWSSGNLYIQQFARDEHSSRYELFPSFGEGSYGGAEIPARQWWDQIVEIGGDGDDRHVFRRKDVISGVANKDGGAHLANAIPDSYHVMSKPGGLVKITFEMEGDTEDVPIAGVHLAMLRQTAYEVLHSPALHRLAEKGTW